MITILTLPEQEQEFKEWELYPMPKHIWHDVPNNIVYIYTGEDIEPVENIQ